MRSTNPVPWLIATLALITLPNLAHAQNSRGGLRAIIDGKAVDMPLTALAVSGDLVGDLASITVEQVYENPYDARIEAVYTFPLPEDAAVSDMIMVIGERRIRAHIKEKKEAQRTYERARREGKTAALLDQERPNVFTQQVANIQPGHPVRILISYVEQIPLEDGRYRFAFPMVVGPRYIPGTPVANLGAGVLHDTDQVADASRITPPVLPLGVHTSYLVDFELRLSSGTAIHDLTSSSHDLDVDWDSERQATIKLPDDDRLPDKDIVFSYALSGDAPSVGLVSHHDDRGGFFSLMVQPPSAPAPDDVRPKEIVFVLDTSGSMSGQPMEASKAVMRHALEHLNPDDSFRIIRFGDTASALAETALPNTAENVRRALGYVESLTGSGGTEMSSGIRAALSPPVDVDHLRIVLFLTDGYIGNDDQVIALVQQLLGDARLFSLGVGSSTNRYLLDKLAEMGRGTVHYVDIDDDPSDVVDTFYQRIQNPVFTDVEVDWGGLDVYDVTPVPVPDVFSGVPLVLTGRYRTPAKGEVIVRGNHGTTPTELMLSVELSGAAEHPAIPFVWARRQVDRLRMGALRYGDAEFNREAILALGLAFGLVTPYTSFVAVDERIVANVADPLHTVAVAVNLPEGVSEEHIGVQITPEYVQPGDPELEVTAPPAANAVTAYYPFGLVQALAFDPIKERWCTRFLVPRDVPDGEYEILVTVAYPDGAIDTMEVPFQVDAHAPRFLAAITTGDAIAVGDLLTIDVRVLAAPLTETPAEVASLGGRVVPDAIKFVRLQLPDGRQVWVSHDDDDATHYVFDFRHKAKLGSGAFDILVEAVDVAGNATYQTLRYEVAPDRLSVAASAR